MIEIILTRGLPGSGKTTWTLQQLKDNPDKYININKDDIREMLYSSIWTKSKEKLVVAVRNFIVTQAMESRKSVIVSDTNLDDSHITKMREIAANYKDVVVRYKDFTDVPVEECIRRNALRPKPVPEHVIYEMYNKYIVPFKDKGFNTHKPYEPVEGLDEAMIIDLDGTLSINDGHRNWYEESKVYDDKVNHYLVKVINGIRATHKNVKLIYVSGRKQDCYLDTARFIRDKAQLPIWGLYMRASNDSRDDAIVKKELYEANIKGKFNIIAVWDDRPKVCVMWHAEGLPIFRLGHPTADF